MMSHPTSWKGTDDGIAALAKVKKARPETEIVLFGLEQPEFRSNFVPLPSRAEVAELLRRSAIFVCPSWEEGFGLPGLEALSCGAALATTDTKGSRDYAIHGETALVSDPRKPDVLADSVLKLLDDVELRRALYSNGLEYTQAHFKPWPEAARVMGNALISSSAEGHRSPRFDIV
jgi:glycosyltransferase involved in cell wall biosynthesis